MKKIVLKSHYDEIFFEFLVHTEPKDTIVYLKGFPSSADQKEKLEFFYEKGYNVFAPSYRGTFQSKGRFLEKDIVQDIINFIKKVRKGKAINLWDGSLVNFGVKKLFLIGGSFSGALCCALSSREYSDKTVLFSPVLDFKKLNEKGDEQEINQLISFVKKAYKNLIRIGFKDMKKKISKYKRLSPNYYLPRLNNPLLVFHDPKDKIVSIRLSRELLKRQNVKLIEHSFGHSPTKTLKEKWPEIKKFLDR